MPPVAAASGQPSMSKPSSQRSPGIVEAIFGYNAGRDPERLAMKYANYPIDIARAANSRIRAFLDHCIEADR